MAPTAPNAKPEISDDDLRRMIYKKKLRLKRRKDRETEGEINELNIYPMLDMMTIILVFLLMSYSASSVTLNGIDNLRPPMSDTTSTPKETVAVTVSTKHILVDNKEVVALGPDGKVPADMKEGGAEGMLIVPLQQVFDKKVEQLKKIASYNPAAPFTGELSVIADQHVSYRLIMEVLYTAGQAELANYRFIVIQTTGPSSNGAGKAGG